MTSENGPRPDLLERLSGTPGYLMRRANQVVLALFQEECRNLVITPVQFAAMTAIVSMGRTDVTRLSQMIDFDKATLGNVIDRLESRGLVRRIPHPDDRRIKLVELSSDGRALLDAASPYVANSQKAFLAPLSPEEQVIFLSLLRKVSGISPRVRLENVPDIPNHTRAEDC